VSPPSARAPLPIDPHLDRIAAALRDAGRLVLVAPPGAGKTTRVPPRLLEDGPVILLQPRRVAARALARRIAEEQGFRLGEEVGWQVRFERRFTPRTRLLVATEGILTARLIADPLLEGFRTVVLDEFHERSLHGDTALALARQAAAARGDLRLVVMSATLDAAPLAAYLGGCPVIEVPGRPHPVAVSYAPGLPLEEAVQAALLRDAGHLLCFLPGAPEIRRAADDLGRGGWEARIVPLHGGLDAEAQDEALRPSERRKVILATNIAETSLTVDGVTEVIDTGLHKVLRHDPDLGLDRLLTERISAASAAQRAGRAGRTAPGRAVRLWDERELLRPHREPEIARADLAAPLLDLLAWGADPRRFEWFEAPAADRLEAALDLLARLGAVSSGRLTERGRDLQRLPLHPRLALLFHEAGGTPAAAAACAVLSEGWRGPEGEPPTTDSDLLSRADRLREAPPNVRRAAEELLRFAGRTGRGAAAQAAPAEGDERLLRAAFAAWPDRVARRREPGSPRFVLASGHGAALGRESGVRRAEFIVAMDVAGGTRSGVTEALVRMASRIERDWLAPTRRDVEHRLDAAALEVRAVERLFYDALVLGERPVAPDPAIASDLLAAHLLAAGLDDAARALLNRLRFAGRSASPGALVRRACAGRTALPSGLDLVPFLDPAVRRDLERLAPEWLDLPSGRRARLQYRDDGSVHAAVKLQEMFGLADSPRLGPQRAPVTFELLAPNGRPVQTTRDLRSFWERTYPEVRRELRARYPKHPWPEDPWAATPTHRTLRKKPR
jgi:ATP-dependent helicase HrpB